MKVVIVVTKGNAVIGVWSCASSENNQVAIERAVAMAVKGGQDKWQALRDLTENGYTQVGDHRITIAERRTSTVQDVPALDA